MLPEFNVTPVFEKNFYSTKRFKVNRGGTRSSKTTSICQNLIIWLFTGIIAAKRLSNGREEYRFIRKGMASIVRKTFPALKATVYRDIIEILHQYNLYSYVEENKTEHILTYGDRSIEFFAADDEQKIRGRKRNILYCNEANELNFKEEFYQLLIRTSDDVFIDFNPDDENVWINTELEQKRQHDMGDVEVIVSNYLDNTFLPETMVKEIEYLQQTDPEFWKIFGLGEYGNITGLIFPDITIVPNMPPQYKKVAYGLDFGFTNDPTTLYEVGLQNGELWINELIYETGLTNTDISDRFRQLGLTSSDEIVCDSAEPKSIEELSRLRWNVKAANKGQDSIKNGIDILKRYKLNITSRSVNLLKEQKRYKWATDRNGNSLNEPVKTNNHAFDALRYVALNHLQVATTPHKIVTRSLGARNRDRRYM